MGHKRKPRCTVTETKELSKTMYYDLSDSQKEMVSECFKQYKALFAINPYVIEFLQPKTNDYIMFVDARDSDCYDKVKQYLEANKNNVSSYCCIGDADYYVEYLGSQAAFERFKNCLAELLKDASKGTGESLIQAYRITEHHIIKRSKFKIPANGEYEISSDEIRTISRIQNDYSAKAVLQLFEGKDKKKQLKKFFANLTSKQILLGYYASGEPVATIRACVLILYTRPNDEEYIIKNRDIMDNVIDLYSIMIDGTDYDPYYAKANLFVLAEFSSVYEYNNWKQTLYTMFSGKGIKVNVFTFVLERYISEIPKSVGNYALFNEIVCDYGEICNQKGIKVGCPIYLDSMRGNMIVCLHLDTIKENGIIVGEPKCGKTCTSVVIASNMLKQRVRVHIVDYSSGITVKKFESVHGALPKSRIVEIGDGDLNYSDPFRTSEHVFIYRPAKENVLRLAVSMLDKIEKMSDSDNVRTTRDVLIFEEAKVLLSDHRFVEKVRNTILQSGRKGYSIWFSTQKIGHIPDELFSNLRNMIVHKIDSNDTAKVASLLLRKKQECIYSNLEQELEVLQIGEALVSFVISKGNGEFEPGPVKIKVSC